jgi:5-methylcytosine-specific restriction endonuclease McrA
MILARDPVCTLCERAASTEVDHIKPRHLGGDDTEENLRGVCGECHGGKTAAEGHAARRGRRRR